MQFDKPIAPLIPKMNKLERAKKTFFYERQNGSVISTNDVLDACRMHKKFKQYGVSDGTRFERAVAEAHRIFMEQGLDAAQQRIRDGEKEEMEAAKGHFETPLEPRVFEPSGPTGFKPMR